MWNLYNIIIYSTLYYPAIYIQLSYVHNCMSTIPYLHLSSSPGSCKWTCCHVSLLSFNVKVFQVFCSVDWCFVLFLTFCFLKMHGPVALYSSPIWICTVLLHVDPDSKDLVRNIQEWCVIWADQGSWRWFVLFYITSFLPVEVWLSNIWRASDSQS